MPDFSFQSTAVEQVMAALGESKSVLLQAPTGAGKTRMAIEIARRCDPPVLFLAESREIIGQSVAAFEAQGIEVETLTADRDTRHGMGFLGRHVTVAAQRTAWSRAVRAGHNIGSYSAVIIDEAHHIRARTYTELLARWPEAKHVLLTATPMRGDGKGLGEMAEQMVQGADYGGNYSSLIDAGVLVSCPPERCYSWPADMRGVKTMHGDYAMGGLRGAARKMDTPKLIGDIVKHWLELGEDRPTIVYASSVGHAQNLREAFRAEGIAAESVDATTPKDERDAHLAGLRSGLVKVVANFGVLTEGFDCPPVSCIVLARPTKLLGLYLQMVGRGLRASPNKSDLLLLDHAGIVPRHGLPGTDITWRLESDDEAAAPSVRKAAPCPECAAILRSNGTCGACGWKPTPKFSSSSHGSVREHDDDEAHDRDSNLERWSDGRRISPYPDQTVSEKSEYWKLRTYAEKRGFKKGWAAVKFKERYGKWPPPAWDLPNPQKVERAEFLEAAKRYAAARKWKPGWAAHQYKEAYGTWPR